MSRFFETFQGISRRILSTQSSESTSHVSPAETQNTLDAAQVASDFISRNKTPDISSELVSVMPHMDVTPVHTYSSPVLSGVIFDPEEPIVISLYYEEE